MISAGISSLRQQQQRPRAVQLHATLPPSALTAAAKALPCQPCSVCFCLPSPLPISPKQHHKTFVQPGGSEEVSKPAETSFKMCDLNLVLVAFNRLFEMQKIRIRWAG
jgi:hypothetical protein